MIVTVTLNAALHVAYTLLARGNDPPRPPLLMGAASPYPPRRSPVLSTGRAGAG